MNIVVNFSDSTKLWCPPKPAVCLHHGPSSSLSCHSFPNLTKTPEVQWSDRIWKMNLSHLEKGELLLHRGFSPSTPLTGLMNLPFPPTHRHKSRDFNQTHHWSLFQRCWVTLWDISLIRDVTQLKLTTCRYDSSFCCVAKVNSMLHVCLFFCVCEYYSEVQYCNISGIKVL